MNKRHYEHTLPNIRGSLSNTYEYLTKGRLILVDGTLSSSLWKDKNGESQIQLSITAESIAFINTGKREDAAAGADNDVNGADSVPVPPADFPQDEKEDLPF